MPIWLSQEYDRITRHGNCARIQAEQRRVQKATLNRLAKQLEKSSNSAQYTKREFGLATGEDYFPRNLAEKVLRLDVRFVSLRAVMVDPVYGPIDFHQPAGRNSSPHSSWASEAQPQGSVRGTESKGNRIRRSCRFPVASGRYLLWCRSGVIRKPLVIAVRH